MPKPLKKPRRKVKIPPKPKRSADPNLAAAMKQLTRDTAADPEDKPPTFDELYRAHMAELGAKGGKKGGKRRLQTMTQAERSAVAKSAAAARWRKKRPAQS